MKKLIIAVAALMVTAAAYGQGTVAFNNRVTGVVDARVLLADGTGAGAGITAQLWGGAVGTTPDKFVALTPSTTFRTTSAAAMGYVNAVTAELAGVPGGAQATLVMRAFNGADWASSSLRGESNPIVVTLASGINTPNNLVGMTSFTLVPEPSTIALGILGAAVLLFRRRK